MGGITGFIDHNNQVSETDLKRASATISHRGGNGSGFIFEQKEHYSIGLAAERLSIFDHSANAQQPLTSACGKYSISINGNIYNYVQLRETLIKYGITFSTLTDTEVILEAYKKWGVSAFSKLDGSFSLTLLDKNLNQLLVARDEIGAKPLYYYKTKGFYAFCSEIRGLLCFPPITKEVNKNAIANYLRYGYFKDDQTIYQNIFKHKKGILTTFDLHSGNNYDMPLILRRSENQEDAVQKEEVILHKIEEYLTESILKKNLADVPVGALLSGGYDSATVAAILQKNQSKRIKTFTVGLPGESVNEAPQAKNIAEHLKTNHHEFQLNKIEALRLLEILPEVSDEPMGDSGAIALLFIAQKIENEVKVLLGADGGDELFGGYRTYAKAIKFESLTQKKVPPFLKNTLKTIVTAAHPKTSAILNADGLLNKYLEVNACFTLTEIDRLLTEPANLITANKVKAETIKGLLIYDLHNYLPNNNLFKSDKCFMHHGIENRNAILNMDLIQYLITLDPKWFLKDGEQKYLLKKITTKYIPKELMKKPKKGFVIPLESWLKTIFKPLVEKYLSKTKLNEHQIFDSNEVEKIKNNFYRNPNAYNAQKVWLLLQFQMWYERWAA